MVPVAVLLLMFFEVPGKEFSVADRVSKEIFFLVFSQDLVAQLLKLPVLRIRRFAIAFSQDGNNFLVVVADLHVNFRQCINRIVK